MDACPEKVGHLNGMAGVLVLAVGACLAAAVALAVRLAHARSPGTIPVGGAAVPAAARRTAGFRLAGVIAGLAAGRSACGRRGPDRTAAVEVRRVRDYLPRGLAAAVTAAASVLAALAAVTTVTAGPDDLGRAGRVLLLSCRPGLQETYGPWPGSFYSVPLAAVVAAGLIAGGGALRVVIRRARTGADPETVAADDALRQRAARTITGACGILVALPLAGICLVSAGALLSLSCAQPGSPTRVGPCSRC